MASTVLPNGIIVPEKFSRDWYADLYHNWQELDNLLGGGTPKDGTLTIQKNGTTVGTFSANQATDETINIEVPDVNNGTLTIQQNGTTVDTFTANSSSDKTVNIQCVDLTNNQTVGGNKEFTGTTTAHDVIPSATDTYNLGSPSYQWNNAYIKSLTINGDLVGSGALSLKSKSGTSRIYLRNNNASAYPSSVNLYSKVGDNPEYGVYLNGQSFHPNITDAMNLGTANLKWKSFNGINPGALSLPSNSYVNIDTTDWDLTCQNGLMGSFTPTADGWLMLHVANSGTNEVNFWIIGGVIRINNRSSLNTDRNDNFNMITIPVEKDKTYNIYGNALEYVAGRRISYCIFMPCRGNV